MVPDPQLILRWGTVAWTGGTRDHTLLADSYIPQGWYVCLLGWKASTHRIGPRHAAWEPRLALNCGYILFSAGASNAVAEEFTPKLVKRH